MGMLGLVQSRYSGCKMISCDVRQGLNHRTYLLSTFWSCHMVGSKVHRCLWFPRESNPNLLVRIWIVIFVIDQFCETNRYKCVGNFSMVSLCPSLLWHYHLLFEIATRVKGYNLILIVTIERLDIGMNKN